ncbi:alpha/beta fold hydrolase [Costertonia aggregata]|uniref:Alpha/beta hydrolase n=1 Tax=Costertonia aggregata TaxID=343403 RepID=A0A7H9ASU5_9FLAO|nr:alpha/beta hydrolase [Costertonia aggregata]QLG46548.1 alpha/beta hydrolase [Costertonia aggregata]
MKYNYEILGKGNHTIVLVHYFGGSGKSWDWVAKRLRKKFRIITITLPGFGGTTPLPELSIFDFAKYINGCIEEIGLDNYLLCGHSMSTKLALYATQITRGIPPKGLVLIAPSPPTIEKMTDEEKNRMLKHPDKNEAIATVENATVKTLRKRRFKLAVESQLQIDEKTWDWWLEKGMLHSIADRIQGIETPTFVICANEDPVIPMNDIFEEVLPYLHKPRLIQLSGCGHLIPLESPRKLAKRLRQIANTVLS